ncbi:hypothetical protein B1813_10660 [Saccharomonospora piscinae]|uniref:Aminoglycoside phosphotransferase domain-containing protein n=1 Tax=Saccharomonospora piscinae TaxID=687388 RepID=A0A1V9A6D1_SACPI|nr:phosphotransferase family protein [Saccharomonospora piscinae]OQO92620.1 hypothetical protein B1813_10660 [Saccharomonospora piscinae]
MRRSGLDGDPLEAVTVLEGGTQNLLLLLHQGDRKLVLRRPHPQGGAPRGNETIRREARVLAALDRTDVPHPRLVAHCDDPEVIGAAFTLTEWVDGFNPGLDLPRALRHDAASQHRLGTSVVDALLTLGRVDPGQVGLAGLGRPDGWIERQPGRWSRQLAGYAGTAGYREDTLPGVRQIVGWLEQHRPPDHRPGLVHGDFHLLNMLACADSGDVTAVVDWELCTQGDPMLDLGHLLSTWPSGDDRVSVPLAAPLPGLPSRGEVVQRYLDGSGRELRELRWFETLARFRLAVIIEGTYVRSLAGRAAPDTGRAAHQRAVGLMEHALDDLPTNGR